MDIQRKMATIRRVDSVSPIEGSENVELARVGGWQVVVKKGDFTDGCLALFLEIDSFIPRDLPDFAFLEKNGVKRMVVDSIVREGYRLKTIKLRKQLSQGLLMPLSVIPGDFTPEEGLDVSGLLNIVKFEPPIPAQLMGKVRGTFPGYVPKTDQERCQNLKNEINALQGMEFEVTEKLDGCFPHDALIPTWDGGSIKIGDLVDNEASPVLIGMDDKGNIVPSFVENKFDNGLKEKWIDIYFDPTTDQKPGYKSKKIQTTPNHVFFTSRGEVTASDLRVGDELITYATCPSKSALHVIKSGLLGDGCISTKWGAGWKYTEGHVSSVLMYTKYLHTLFGDSATALNVRISGYGSTIHHFATKQYHELKSIREEWYPDGKKALPKDLSWIDDFSVAKWYMDDGSLAHNTQQFQNDRAHFATCAFTQGDVQRLADKLFELYGVDCTVYESKGFWNIRINYSKGTINKMWEAISPYIVPCMRYKLPKEFRSVPFKEYTIGKEILKKYSALVKKIECVPKSRKRRIGYDVETSTHNYMCNGVLVHNSSCTILSKDSEIHVCSRNMDLKSEGTYERETTFWRVATDTKIVEKLTALARNIAIQGECIGEGIQKNPYNIKGQTLRIFDIYDIDANQYLTREERSQLLADLDLIGLQVPVIDGKYALSADTDGLLKMAEGKSQMADVEREGIVFKALERKDKMIFSFKAISNNYLLNEKE